MWTKESVELITAKWKAGESATHIAKSLGTTRGAVMGKIRRLGVTRQWGEGHQGPRPITLPKLSFDDK